MHFYLNFESPTTKEVFKIRELTFSQFKTLNKYILSNNNTNIEEYFNTILKENLFSEEDLYKFTNFDKFCCLLMLRCVCVSSEIEMYEANNTLIKVNLAEFLSKCVSFQATFTKTFEIDTLKINLGLPQSFIFENFVNLSDKLIKSVEVDGEIIDLTKISVNEITDIISNLPATAFPTIHDFFSNLNNEFLNLKLKVPTFNESIVLNPFDSSMLELLKLLFKTNLNNLYEMQYIMVSKLNYSAEYLDNSTFIESLIILKMYEGEIKKQEELNKTKSPINIGRKTS